MSFHMRRGLLARAVSVGAGISAAVLADSPFAWWKMGDTSGAITIDYSGNGRDMTGSNVTPGNRGTSGIIADGGLSTTFNTASGGSTVYTNTSGAIPAISGDVNLGFFCVIKPTSFASDQHLIQNGNTGVGGSQGRLLMLATNGSLQFYGFVAGVWTQFNSPAGTIVLGEPALVGWWHDAAANTLQFFKNGVQVGVTNTLTGGIGNANKDWTIGGVNLILAANTPMQHAMVFTSLSGTASTRFLAHAQAMGF